MSIILLTFYKGRITMNYSKALLLATMAILATFSPVDAAMKQPTRKIESTKRPAPAFIMSPGSQPQESGEESMMQEVGMNPTESGIEFRAQQGGRRTANENQGAGLERLQ